MRYSKKRKQKRRRIVALLIVIGIPAFIIFRPMGGETLDLTLGAIAQTIRPVPAVQTQNGNIIVNITPDERDYWRQQQDHLELWLHNAQNMLGTEDKWLEQHVAYRWQGDSAVIVINLDSLPPIFRIKTLTNSYKIITSEQGIKGKRVAIDPGHGGHDPGSVGHHGLLEKDVNLSVSIELKQILEDAGAEVFVTRSGDNLVDSTVQPGQHIRPDLWARRDVVQEWDPDFYVSIHVNSFIDRTVGGTEVYYNKNSFNSMLSQRAAESILDSLVNELGRRDRGVRTKADAVIQVDNFPAVLIEMLYISNVEEEAIMAQPDFPGRAAQGIFQGIEDFFIRGSEYN